MLPNITLSATWGANAGAAGDLFSAGSAAWNLGAGLTAPLFHGGALNEERKAAVEARDATFQLYRRTVLAAFEQVADSLRALEHDAELLAAESEAMASAGEAVRLIQANYAAGTATYLQVLIADEQYVQARIGYVQAVGLRLQDTIALYVALGGGWWNAPAPS
jgi:outer membrane protein TolC